ncbi:MAG TPA: penicillin acylase family protein [Candidatus Aquilonibacter sp.]|nr:penicillin acylase family protein [Candidatus Aquilonibacter sp.]
MRGALRVAGIVALIVVVAAAAFVVNVALGMRSKSTTTGTLHGLALREPVEILRDARGIPHIRAANRHDLFFAQGYAEASDRGFQLDLLRRYVYGELAAVLGPPLLSTDERARQVPVAAIVQRQWQAMDAPDRAMLQAFADGVNAAYAREAQPVEFRLLMYKPQPWRPQDSLAVGFATVLDLADSWDDVAARIGKHLPLTDPCYDAPVMAGLAKIADPAHCNAKTALLPLFLDHRPPIGSNEWATGSAHNATHRSLLANDPHLRLAIPGIWYLADLQAPGFHAAGAVLAGIPGITLGHNDHVAWGATNGTVTALSVFYPPKDLPQSNWQTETFNVRFGKTRTKRYYRDRDLFGVTVNVRNAKTFVLVRWSAYANAVSPLPAFNALDQAGSIEDALRALHAYPGPTQNFAIADTSGRVAYQLAGEIPDDPLWGRAIHPSSDLRKTYPMIPFAALPHVSPSRSAIVWTANAKMYGDGYPYRLSAAFSPPYRAYRIAEMLRSRPVYDVPYFTSMQLDTLSVSERDLAHYFKEYRAWNGRFTPNSKTATAVFDARRQLAANYASYTQAVDAARAKPGVVASVVLAPSPQPWGAAGAVVVKHPLAALGMSFLNGTTFPGNGDAYTVKVQNVGFSQSFRAVWDVGNWDTGGITIPQGNSGRPGSRHYTDEAAAWVAGRLLPLPYSTNAVDAATTQRLTLRP